MLVFLRFQQHHAVLEIPYTAIFYMQGLNGLTTKYRCTWSWSSYLGVSLQGVLLNTNLQLSCAVIGNLSEIEQTSGNIMNVTQTAALYSVRHETHHQIWRKSS